ncbi:NRDE family protein [Hydrogenophaga sp. 5NK40-0174]|uniref:NRDE family protein n=1 Tax=Hydrogenophaga sp. 5NK40-0174 TaxID=3127649 RepID=UPI00310A9280
MCLLAFAIASDTLRPFVMASNRDEFFARPTQGLHTWSTASGVRIHAGRDEKDGGTWLGVNDHGRIAMLTNVRSGLPEQGQRSRGELTTGWLSGEITATQWLNEIEPANYGGFNLVIGDVFTQNWFWCSNRSPADPHQPATTELHVQALRPGTYGLSNAALDTPWPKTATLRNALRSAVAENRDDLASQPGPLTDALASRYVDPYEPLPQTGVSPEAERALASAFISIPTQGYGTRCSTVVQVTGSAQHGTLQLQMDEWTHPPSPETAAETASWANSEHRQLKQVLRGR